MKMIDTTLCYIEKDGKYLMLHRNKKENDINKDKWIGIGGKLEEGETVEECLKREVREETGLTLTEYEYRGIISFYQINSCAEYMHLFTAKGFTGELTECDEGELVWVGKEDIYSLNLWEGDRVFLEKIKEPGPFFTLELVYDGDRLRHKGARHRVGKCLAPIVHALSL